jgi:hypothetical protein
VTTYFVNKSGNDSNSGLSASAAVLTINRARELATVSGDIIRVQSGVYSETMGAPFTSGVILLADGVVIVDGQNSITRFVDQVSVRTLTIRGFRFRKFTSEVISTPGIFGTFTDCWFEQTPNAIASPGSPAATSTFERCIFEAMTSIAIDADLRNLIVRSCTFANCAKGIRSLVGAGGANAPQLLNCIFFNNTVHHESLLGAASFSPSNGNCYFPFDSTHTVIHQGTTYTSLAALQAATSQESISISTDPLFVDDAKGLYGLRSSSPCLVNGLLSVADGIIGARNRKLTGGNGVMDGLSANRNPTIWNPPTGSPAGTAVAVNMIQDGSGNWILVPGQTTGSVTFEMSLIPAVKIGRNFFRQFVFYPLGVFDHLKTDTQPNRLTYEYAVDTGSGFGALTAIEPDSYASDPATGFRDLSPGAAATALRIKVTARKDGASA